MAIPQLNLCTLSLRNSPSLISERLHELIYENKVIHTDETPVKVMRIDNITGILHTDNEFDDLSNTDRRKQRQTKLQEKVDAYFEWVKQKYSQVTHNSTIGKALAYSINQEKYLLVFLNDGMVPPDNNYAEQAIRPFTIGRKNFVLMESDNGAKASAMLYSLVKTARANKEIIFQGTIQIYENHFNPCSNAGFYNWWYS